MKTILYSVICLLLLSCGGIRIEKRRYNRGVFMEFGNTQRSNSAIKIQRQLKIHPVRFSADSLKLNSKHGLDLSFLKNLSTRDIPISESKIMNDSDEVRLALSTNNSFKISPDNSSGALKRYRPENRKKAAIQIQKAPSERNSLWASSLAVLGLLLSFIALLKKWKSLVNFAIRHPKKSRWILGSAMVVHGFGVFLIGKWLNVHGAHSGINLIRISLLAMIAITASDIYRRMANKSAYSLVSKKLHLLGVSGATTLLLASIGLKGGAGNTSFSKLIGQGTDYLATSIMPTIGIAGDGQGAKYILLIIGIVLLTLILMFAIAALSCNLSCSGYEVMGMVVLLGGWTVVLTLAVIGIVLLAKRMKAVRHPEAVPEETKS